MKKNVNQNPTHRANLSRNGFDVSQTVKFTSACGQLLPVYYDFALPGDKYKLSAEIFTRTQPLVKPALLQARHRVDWFFVPANSIYQFFEDMQFETFDSKTDFVDENHPKVAVPRMKVSDLSAEFQLHYGGLTSDSKTAAIDETMRDMFGIPTIFNADRLCQLLRYGRMTSPLFNLGKEFNQDYDCRLSILAIASYQKIYSDIYRLSNREINNPYKYNFDSCWNTDVSQQRLYDLFELHYRPWELDYFTNNYPTPQVDNINANDQQNFSGSSISARTRGYLAITKGLTETIGSDWLANDFTSAEALQTFANSSAEPDSSIRTDNILDTNPSAITASNLRALFALSKRQEITRRAAKHCDSQILAHYGISVPKDVLCNVSRLGSDEANIQISDVVSTAETADGALGQLAGRGLAYNNGKVKEFTCPCHGIIMAIASIIPECDYPADGIDKHHTHLFAEDFYQPEFDRLGMQPLYGYEFGYWVPQDPDANTPWTILGFQYRYMEYKQKCDFACCGFTSGGDVSHYTALRDFFVESSQASLYYHTSLYPYYINPNYLDNIFEVAFRFNSLDEKIRETTCYARDPFINMIRFNVYKTSVMSVYGLPVL